MRIQMPLRLAPLSMPEPDIAIVAPGLHTRAHPDRALLVIEVAVTTRAFNLGAKAEIYAASGIAEYRVVDVRARAVHVHESPSEAGYDSRREVATGALRAPVAGAPAIDVESLFALLD